MAHVFYHFLILYHIILMYKIKKNNRSMPGDKLKDRSAFFLHSC